MSCRICIELERFLKSAQDEGSPSLLVGLTEAGKRNREHQHRERILKAELDVTRHKKTCPETLVEAG